MKSVHINQAKFLQLEVNTLSPSYWHFDVSTRDWGKVSTARGLYYYIESQYLTHVVSTLHWCHVLLLEVTTTTLIPSYWHYDASTRDWGKVSTARGLYYYIESQYLTHEVSTHQWGQGFTAKVILLHLIPVSDTELSVHVIEAKFPLLEVCTTTLSPSIWNMK